MTRAQDKAPTPKPTQGYLNDYGKYEYHAAVSEPEETSFTTDSQLQLQWCYLAKSIERH